jgi:ligand-binding sensor domain-containing protein
VHAIFEDDSGKVWLGTREETWANDSSPGSRFEIVERMPDRVKAICQDKEGRLWLGADSEIEFCANSWKNENGRRQNYVGAKNDFVN